MNMTVSEDSVSDPRHPFGLAMGSVRGFLSLLICGFFWMVLLWPGDQVVKALLGHIIMLFLVLLAFAAVPKAGERGESRIIPRLMQVLFVGGSLLVLAYSFIRTPDIIRSRLTPDIVELSHWWGPFMAVMFGGFAAGKMARIALGSGNVVFLTLRSWLSVVGMVLLALEYVIVLAIISAEQKPEEFLRYWQAFELGIVSAYFGSRV